MSNLLSNINLAVKVAEEYVNFIKFNIINARFKKKFIEIVPSHTRYHLRLLTIMPLALAAPRVAFNYAYDFKRFVKWSAVSGNFNTQTQLRALIIMDYHRIEKGLALKEPKFGFGSDVIQRLLANLKKYHENYGLDETGQVALNVLYAYYDFNLQHGLDNEQLYQEILALKEINSRHSNINQGGVLEVTKKQINEAAKIKFKDFAEARYSIRNFAQIDVDMDLIQQAITIAQKTPSVCNRQSAKVHIYQSHEDKKRVLNYQNGNRGFGEQANKVLIVTSELQHFVSPGERNQAWIDGGMFAMSLIYALHSLGLGTCCLNWSVEHQSDKNLKQIARIKDSEVVIMMIAVGHLPDSLKVAQSPRKHITDVIVVH